MSQLPIASTSTLLPAYSPTPPSAQSLSPGELLIRAKNHLETLIEGSPPARAPMFPPFLECLQALGRWRHRLEAVAPREGEAEGVPHVVFSSSPVCADELTYALFGVRGSRSARVSPAAKLRRSVRESLVSPVPVVSPFPTVRTACTRRLAGGEGNAG